jgi:hypothetical protein
VNPEQVECRQKEKTMNEYTVELRIHGADLDPAAITNALNLEPTLVRNQGDRRGKNTHWEEGMWAYNGFPESHGSKVWESLEEGFTFTLEKLLPIRSKLEDYKKTFKVILWCGHFQSGMNSSFNLSPRALRMLGDFGVELFIDNYTSTE